MIKYRAGNAKQSIFGFVLSEGNLQKLREGKPIHINLAEMKGPANIEILISYSETEEKAYQEMKHLIEPDTEVLPLRSEH